MDASRLRTARELSAIAVRHSSERAVVQRQRLVALGSMAGALAASSCCIVPLLLFSLGIGGAWIGNLTALAPYKPLFVAGTLGLLGYGFYLVYWKPKWACADGAALRASDAEPPRAAAPLDRDRARGGCLCIRLRRPGAAWRLRQRGDHPMRKCLSALALIGFVTALPAALAGERTMTFAVENMTSASCPYIVKTSLTAVPGVAKVTVSFEAKTATVIFDDAKPTAEAIAAAVTQAGFPAQATRQGS